MKKRAIDPSVLMGYLMIVGVFIVGAVLYGAFRYYENQSAGALSVVNTNTSVSQAQFLSGWNDGKAESEKKLNAVVASYGVVDLTNVCVVNFNQTVPLTYANGKALSQSCIADQLKNACTKSTDTQQSSAVIGTVCAMSKAVGNTVTAAQAAMTAAPLDALATPLPSPVASVAASRDAPCLAKPTITECKTCCAVVHYWFTIPYTKLVYYDLWYNGCLQKCNQAWRTRQGVGTPEPYVDYDPN
jgi:hypothetical protein